MPAGGGHVPAGDVRRGAGPAGGRAARSHGSRRRPRRPPGTFSSSLMRFRRTLFPGRSPGSPGASPSLSPRPARNTPAAPFRDRNRPGVLLNEIGTRFTVSRQRICQIEAAALRSGAGRGIRGTSSPGCWPDEPTGGVRRMLACRTARLAGPAVTEVINERIDGPRMVGFEKRLARPRRRDPRLSRCLAEHEHLPARPFQRGEMVPRQTRCARCDSQDPCPSRRMRHPHVEAGIRCGDGTRAPHMGRRCRRQTSRARIESEVSDRRRVEPSRARRPRAGASVSCGTLPRRTPCAGGLREGWQRECSRPTDGQRDLARVRRHGGAPVGAQPASFRLQLGPAAASCRHSRIELPKGG
jgi:hypothetical protein